MIHLFSTDMKAPSTPIVALTVILCFLEIWCQEPQPYELCKEGVLCGNTPPGQQFWGPDSAAHCSRPGFELTCQSSFLLPTQMITMARNDLWSNLCPRYLDNTTYDTAIFNSSNFDQEGISMYYSRNSKLSYTVFEDLNTTNSFCSFVRTVRFINGAISSLGPLTVDNEECNQCIRSGGQCGSNGTSPALFACLNSTRFAGSGGSVRKFNLKWMLVIGLSSSIAGIMLLLVVILCRKKRIWEIRKATNHQIEIFIRNYETLSPKRYRYSEIKKMTNSFSEKLGQGGYASVYKGQLPEGQLVAVKLLSGAMADGEDFINEVASIGRTSHINVITLLGFCVKGKRRALVYEFMPNGSLDKFIRSNDDTTTDSFTRLDWKTLFQIAKGIARGLDYLHRGCNTRIVHFDIKPHNILLDEEFVPKISDFGLSKLCKRKESIVSIMGARGTAGYISPEVFFKSFGGASHKSDVYSYGMMVLEMTGARKKNDTRATSTSEEYFPDWIYKQVEDEESLGVYGVTTEEEDELARKMMMVSLWCIQSDPSDRPSISKVVDMLDGNLQSLQVPPKRFWSSPPRLFISID